MTHTFWTYAIMILIIITFMALLWISCYKFIVYCIKNKKSNRSFICGIISLIMFLISIALSIICILEIKYSHLSIEIAIIHIIFAFSLNLASFICALIGNIGYGKLTAGKILSRITLILEIPVAIFLVFSSIYTTRYSFPSKTDDLEHTSNLLSIDVTEGKYKKRIELHSRLSYDGEYFAIIEFNNKNDLSEKLAKNSCWSKLPMPKSISDFLYDIGEDDQTNFIKNSKIKISEISNGYYFFLNRYTLENPKDPDLVDPDGPFNLSIALYDTDKMILYLYEIDS